MSCRFRLARRRTAFRCTLGAAVIREIADERRHGGEVSRVDELAALASVGDQPRPLQTLQVEGQGGGYQAHAFGDLAGRQPCRTSLNQQAEDREAMLVRQCA